MQEWGICGWKLQKPRREGKKKIHKPKKEIIILQKGEKMTSFFPACSIFMNYAMREEIELPSCDVAPLNSQAPMPVGCFVQTFNHKWSPGLGPALESSLIHVCKGPAGKIKADWQHWAAADTCPHLSSTMPRIWQEVEMFG